MADNTERSTAGVRKVLTIGMDDEFAAEMARLADEMGVPVTEMLRRYVALGRYVWEHRDSPLDNRSLARLARMLRPD